MVNIRHSKHQTQQSIDMISIKDNIPQTQQTLVMSYVYRAQIGCLVFVVSSVCLFIVGYDTFNLPQILDVFTKNILKSKMHSFVFKSYLNLKSFLDSTYLYFNLLLFLGSSTVAQWSYRSRTFGHESQKNFSH